MDELKKRWAERARTTQNSSDANFWAVMASDAPLSIGNVDAFRAFILQELAIQSDGLINSIKQSGINLAGCEENIERIKEMVDQYAAISDMLNFPHAGTFPLSR